MKHVYGPTAILVFVTTIFITSCAVNLSTEDQNDLNRGQSDFKVVGYLLSSNLDKIDQIDLKLLTHLDLAFANPDEKGNLVFQHTHKLPQVVTQAHQNNVKVYLSIAGGGINQELAENWLFVLQAENRTEFIGQILSFVQKYDLDGVDVDIEWNLLPTIDSLYTPFVVELKNVLHAQNKGISSALNVSGLHQAITQESLQAYDFINVMVYDKTGIWEPHIQGPHAPYSYAEEALKYWTIERNIPPERLTLGVPFYGHDFNKIKYVSYRNIIIKNPVDAYKDESASIFYNGIPSIVEKTKLAINSFGGIMIWELSNDTFDDLSLLRAIHQVIEAKDCGENKIKTYFKDVDSDGYGDLMKPLQACSAPSQYVSNRLDCDDSNQNIHPKALEIIDGIDNNCDGKVDLL